MESLFRLGGTPRTEPKTAILEALRRPGPAQSIERVAAECLGRGVPRDVFDRTLGELRRGGEVKILLDGEPVPVNGMRMFIHPPQEDISVSGNMAAGGEYERFESGVMNQVLRPGMGVLDVGANIGYYTLLSALKVGPSGRVLAVEPDPANFLVLQKNLVEHRLTNTSAYCLGFAAAGGVGEIHLSKGNWGDHRIWADPSEPGRGKKPVRLANPDEFLADWPRPFDVVKVDTQGAECLFLRHAKKTLARSPRTALFIELWPRGLAGLGGSTREFATLLRENGFDKLYAIGSGDDRITELPGVDYLAAASLVDAAGVPQEDGLINLVCTKGGGLETWL